MLVRVAVLFFFAAAALCLAAAGNDPDPFFDGKEGADDAGERAHLPDAVVEAVQGVSDTLASALQPAPVPEKEETTQSDLQINQGHKFDAIDPFFVELEESEELFGVDGDDDELAASNAMQVEAGQIKAAGLSSSRRRRRRETASPSPSVSVAPESPSASTVPSASASSEPSSSASATPTSSPSETSSASITPSISVSTAASHTPSASRSPVASPDPSHSPSNSESPPASPTPSSSPAASPSPTPSPSESPSQTVTASASFSPSTSVSHGPTESASVSFSPSVSVSALTSVSPSRSVSASVSPPPSQTPSPSLTPTTSETPSTSPTPTPSAIPLPPEPTRAVVAVVPSPEPFEPHPLERAMYADETKALWSYDPSSENGPEYWSTLDKSFSTCSEDSTAQSPLDLYTFRIASPMSPLLTPQYKAGQMLVRNTGNYLRLIPHKGSLLFWGDKVFELVYAQIHTPSEHHMSGETFPVEVQFVHKSQDDAELAVLALLYKQGLENPFISRVLEAAPVSSGKEEFLGGAVNLGDAIPKDITQYKAGTRVSYPHYTYDGSLSTPPCTENTRWFVWSKPDHISKDQVDALKRLVKTPSTRPLQSVNGRVVQFKTLF